MRLALALAAIVALSAPAWADTGFEIRVPDKLEVAAGTTGTLPIAIAVDRGLTLSRDAALIVDLDPGPPPGLAIKRHRLGRAEAVDPEADAPRFAVPVRADAPGDRAVAIRVRFWLCGARVCRPIDVKRSVAIAVTPASDPPLDH